MKRRLILMKRRISHITVGEYRKRGELCGLKSKEGDGKDYWYLYH